MAGKGPGDRGQADSAGPGEKAQGHLGHSDGTFPCLQA
jgi:hypothetical protein